MSKIKKLINLIIHYIKKNVIDPSCIDKSILDKDYSDFTKFNIFLILSPFISTESTIIQITGDTASDSKTILIHDLELGDQPVKEIIKLSVKKGIPVEYDIFSEGLWKDYESALKNELDSSKTV